MGWVEELHEPAKAASVLWVFQGHPGLRQNIQEPPLLLDPWGWPLRKFRHLNMLHT